MTEANSSPGRHWAAFVLYNPENSAFLENIGSVIRAGLSAVVFDNSEDPAINKRLKDAIRSSFGTKVAILEEACNIGLSAAYNRIIDYLESQGDVETVLLLDQDSTVPVESAANLVATYMAIRDRQPVGVLAGVAVAPDSRPYRVRRSVEDGGSQDSLVRVRMAQSSFSLIPLATFRATGRFHDDFFIDHIDVDFCARCRASGLLVALDPSAPFPHQIGAGIVSILGWPVSPISAPFRNYYQVRNIILSARRRNASPWSTAYEVAKKCVAIGIVGLAAGRLLERCIHACRGLLHGVQGRAGPMPPRKVLS